jgi:hypothetical protein
MEIESSDSDSESEVEPIVKIETKEQEVFPKKRAKLIVDDEDDD